MKLSHSPFRTMRQPQLAPLTMQPAIFSGLPQTKRPTPLMADGQNDLKRWAFAPPTPQNYPKTILPQRNLILPPQSGKNPVANSAGNTLTSLFGQELGYLVRNSNVGLPNRAFTVYLSPNSFCPSFSIFAIEIIAFAHGLNKVG